MITNEIFVNSINYIQAIIWFILTGYLIYLTLKTKLTYVDKFRKNFILSIFILIISVSIYLIFRDFFSFSEQFYQILVLLLIIGLISFIVTMIISYRSLIEYVNTLIDIEERNNAIIALLITIILDMSVFIISLTLNIVQYSIVELFIGRALFMGFFFSAIYTFLLHQEMKSTNIKIMVYFGFGFLSFALMDFIAIFLHLMNNELGTLVINSFVIIMLAFFILGYLSFKKRFLAEK